jgi:hypothetical protein
MHYVDVDTTLQHHRQHKVKGRGLNVIGAGHKEQIRRLENVAQLLFWFLAGSHQLPFPFV